MSPAAITCQPSHALQTLASGQRQRQLPSVVIVARRLLLATANGSQNSPTGAATYRPSKLTPTGHRNRRATPAFGRLLPMPLLVPYAEWGVFAAVMLWPLIAIVADRRRRGHVHPALWWGTAAIILMQASMTLMAHSVIGLKLYAVSTSGHRGAAVPPLAFPMPPSGPLITGR